MCGIFGVIARGTDGSILRDIRQVTDDLFRISESRGKDASGIAIRHNGHIRILKGPVRSSKLVKTPEYHRFWDAIPGGQPEPGSPLVVLGHSRMATNGSEENNGDNQPLVKNSITGVFNGIITNEATLWKDNPDISRETTTDTEILFGLVDKYLGKTHNVHSALDHVFLSIEGAASLGIITDTSDFLALATNNGSLYTMEDPEGSTVIFASERSFLRQVAKKYPARIWFGTSEVHQVPPGVPRVFDLGTGDEKTRDGQDRHAKYAVTRFDVPPGRTGERPGPRRNREIPRYLKDEYAEFSRRISKIRRCTRCILPETFPFIEFDSQGVCSYCRGHHPINASVRGPAELETILGPHRKTGGEPDCFVAVSGGRDSCYGLHYVKNVLRMTPLAYTYDWGMVTDLARRNISRMCGKLGVEHILVSADIRKKRENIRANIRAWLKKPDLGMVPLFMAGDKQFLYYAHELMKENDIRLFIWFTNTFEVSDFKEGFCGVSKSDLKNPARTWALSTKNKVRLMYYYLTRYLQNPGYLNKSVLDTIFAFYSYYILPEYNLYLYNYIPWNEREILDVLQKRYNWETAPDTRSTWRVGDGTAGFYNYIYYVGAGFSEHDTFLSKLIREGMLSRDEALSRSTAYNQPRYDSLVWYADTVDFDLERALQVIHAMPKLYEKQGAYAP